MSIRRFYCQQIPARGQTVALCPEESRHAVRVLRLCEGDDIVVLDGAGVQADAVVAAVVDRKHRELLTCSIRDRRECHPPRLRIRLCVAIPRGKLMGRIVQDATELGVWQITPVFCRFSVARPDSPAVVESWRRDIVEAVKQSGNPFAPHLDAPCLFHAALAESSGCGYFGAVPSEGLAGTFHPPAEPALLDVWVGPEGGFAEEEQASLRERGLVPLTLGQWVLRVETAVPALLGYLLGINR